MSNCATEPNVASMLPDFARNAHGNLAEQNRLVGPQHGADTSRPAGAPPSPGAAATAKPAAAAATTAASPTPTALLNKHACSGCHAVDGKLVGPSFREVAVKQGNRADALAYLTGKIRAGGVGVWGQVPMPPQGLPEDDAKTIARWLTEGARK
jgi:cytochrome c